MKSHKTTLMIKNIPNRYKRHTLLKSININHKDKFDFFYLPIDFEKNLNFGYAFINFISTKFIERFYLEFNAKKWNKFHSKKVCEIRYATT